MLNDYKADSFIVYTSAAMYIVKRTNHTKTIRTEESSSNKLAVASPSAKWKM